MVKPTDWTGVRSFKPVLCCLIRNSFLFVTLLRARAMQEIGQKFTDDVDSGRRAKRDAGIVGDIRAALPATWSPDA